MFSKRTHWKLTPNRFTEVQRELRARGREVVDLTASNPTRAGLRYDADAILNSLSNREAMDYDPQPKGLDRAREAVGAYYREQHCASEIDPEALMLTTSTSEGYSYVLRLLCNPDDEILVPKPSYPLFAFLADLQDVRLTAYPLLYDHGWQIDFPSLSRAVNSRTRAVVVVHPNNPTGSYISEGERTQLNAFCREHGIALIVDEVFLDYPLRDSTDAVSFAVGEQPCMTFILSGMSKIAGLPQMKVAWVMTVGPDEVQREALGRLEVIADTFLSMSAPVQLALPRWLGSRKAIQTQILERTRGNLAALDESGIPVLRADAGWSACLRVPGSAEELVRELGVVVHPGSFYGMAETNRIVVSLLTRKEEFAEGIGMISRYLASRL